MKKILKSDYAKILALFIFWRICIFFAAYISVKFIPVFGAKFPYYQETLIETGLPHFIWSLGNFDGVHYLRIAKDGYVYQFTQAFFPLYPILIRVVSYVTFGNLLIAALFVSNASFLLGVFVFFKLTSKIYNKNTAFWSTLFLFSFPTSYYFGAVYTEGLFFLLITAAFYLKEKNKIWQASIIGAFASATRLFGIFLAPSLARGFKFKNVVPVSIVSLGLITYMIYLKFQFNNPIYFLTSQTAFGQERSTTQIILLPQVFFRYIKILLTSEGQLFANALFELLATIFVFLVLILGFKKVKIEWLIFSTLAILTPTLTGTLNSMPRYILIAFPMYIILAQIKSFKIKTFILAVFTTLLFAATVIFAQGYWVA